MVRAYNKQTKKAKSAKGIINANLVWKVSLLCKDVSTAGNSCFYRIHVQSHEGLGTEFFGKPQNLHRDEGALKRVED